MAADSVLSPDNITLPEVHALAVSASQAYVLTPDGEVRELPHEQARLALHKQEILLCHAPSCAARLGLEEYYAYDVLELFAFTHPTLFTVPTIAGVCKALGLSAPETLEDQSFALIDITRALLCDLQKDAGNEKANPLKIAEVMGMSGKGWGWTPYICATLGSPYEPSIPTNPRGAMNIWKHMPEWSEEAPEPPPSHFGVNDAEVEERLTGLLGQDAEVRDAQFEYAKSVAAAFSPPEAATASSSPPPAGGLGGEHPERTPHMILAEAGTGVGKTLGYLAPASVWAEKNKGSVWISTYTKNLQRQIDSELDRLYPDADVKDVHVATRKGRENYLCLLNLEDMTNGVATARHINTAIGAGIMARWTAASKDGDLSGGEFPGWLPGLLGYANTKALADRRGECIFSACDHYHKCFVEKSQRKAERARIIVSNHALSMITAALSAPGDALPSRVIFDEGHHLFSAADSAFAAHLTARETKDLRRWLLGAEGGKRSRARGLKRRCEDLIEGDEKAAKALQDILGAAHELPGEGWTKRMQDSNPLGPAEGFMLAVYRQVFARADGRDGPYSLETEVHPVGEELMVAGAKLRTALQKLLKPMQALTKILLQKLADDKGAMAADTRRRIDALCSSLERRGVMQVGAWTQMLDTMLKGETAEQNFIDWLEIERINGRAIDVGLFRHHLDPMKPMADSFAPHLHGLSVTSATLRDQDKNWDSAMILSGARHLNSHAKTESFPSPFNYPERTKVYIINDVRRDDMAQVAGAYRALFKASGGGGLGLFTAISRLKSVHDKIAADLEGDDIPLYAQHVDEMEAGTLVDIFRDEERACLLGTDAVRDGVDVPGRSLRLLIFDRVPWPRPTILHKARREYFAAQQNSGSNRFYDEMITRMKLKQAYGRLIRRADDKGVFVMMDPMFPSRLHDAFPEGVEVIKCGLSEACDGIRQLLG